MKNLKENFYLTQLNVQRIPETRKKICYQAWKSRPSLFDDKMVGAFYTWLSTVDSKSHIMRCVLEISVTTNWDNTCSLYIEERLIDRNYQLSWYTNCNFTGDKPCNFSVCRWRQHVFMYIPVFVRWYWVKYHEIKVVLTALQPLWMLFFHEIEQSKTKTFLTKKKDLISRIEIKNDWQDNIN